MRKEPNCDYGKRNIDIQ